MMDTLKKYAEESAVNTLEKIEAMYEMPYGEFLNHVETHEELMGYMHEMHHIIFQIERAENPQHLKNLLKQNLLDLQTLNETPKGKNGIAEANLDIMELIDNCNEEGIEDLMKYFI